jgi:hypothetical protein
MAFDPDPNNPFNPSGGSLAIGDKISGATGNSLLVSNGSEELEEGPLTNSVEVSTASIDLCRSWSNGVTTYAGVTSGTDITTALQAAINYVATFTYGGEIYFSVPGIYWINGALQAGTALGYAYNGQVLFPAVNYISGQSVPITIRGPFDPSSGDLSTGQANGVVLLSNATAGYVFDCIPAQSQFGYEWTGIMPIFKDLVIRGPSNPQCGGIKISVVQRCKLERVIFDPNGSLSSTAPSSGNEALVLPAHFNNGDVTLRNAEVRGWTTAIRLSEHAALDNVDISYCGTAFTKGDGAGGHANWFGYVDVEECQTIFAITGTNTGLTVMGSLDMENVETSGTLQPQVFANIPTGCSLSGDLALNIDGTGSLGYVGGGALNMNLRPVGSGGAGSAAEQPADTLARLAGVALTAATGAPGLCSPTLAGWRVTNGGFAVSGGVLTATSVIAQAVVPCRERGKSRAINAYFTTGATSYDCGLIFSRRYNSGSSPWFVRLHSGNLILGSGGYGGTVLQTVTGVIANSTSYLVTVEIYYQSGSPYLVRVLLNGVVQIEQTLTAAQQEAIAPSTTPPFLEDGVVFNETQSSLSVPPSYTYAFWENDLSGLAPVSQGTAILSGGTISVANALITANSKIRVFNNAAGGTPGALSVALTPGTGFAINSTSALDTSTIYYEIVNY